MFTCDKCKRSFRRKCHLRRHITKNKRECSQPKAAFVCYNCNKNYRRKSSLKDHILSKCLNPIKCNNRTISATPSPDTPPKTPSKNIQVLHFDNHAEFLLWKDAEEQRTVSKYSQDRGMWKTKNGRHIKYTCHRAGYVRVKPPECRKRLLKRQGSCKINDHCTAYILWTEMFGGKIEVQYHPTHVNHDIEMKHLPHSTIEKNRIADLLREGVPMDRILDDIRRTKHDSPSLSRTQLMTKHDLHNIKVQYGISLPERLSIDGVVEEMLVDESRIAQLVLDADTHLKQIRDGHAAGKCIPKEDISIIDDETAVVRSQSGIGTYLITRLKLECTCRMRCSECNMCVHVYQCSCADNAAGGNFCKHLHLFGIVKSENFGSYDIDHDVFGDMTVCDGQEIHSTMHVQSPKEPVRENAACTLRSLAHEILRGLENLSDADFGDDGDEILNLLTQIAELIELKKKKNIEKKGENNLKRVAPNEKFDKQVCSFPAKKKRDTRNAVCKPTAHQRIEMTSMVFEIENIPVVISNNFEDHTYRLDMA